MTVSPGGFGGRSPPIGPQRGLRGGGHRPPPRRAEPASLDSYRARIYAIFIPPDYPIYISPLYQARPSHMSFAQSRPGKTCDLQRSFAQTITTSPRAPRRCLPRLLPTRPAPGRLAGALGLASVQTRRVAIIFKQPTVFSASKLERRSSVAAVTLQSFNRVGCLAPQFQA